jgi:hypothetical protein
MKNERERGRRIPPRLSPVLVALVLTLAACAVASAPAATPGASTEVATGSVGAVSAAPSAVRPEPHQPLPAGTYTSEVFATPLTYTVPDGWKMFEDEAGQFGLALVANVARACACGAT